MAPGARFIAARVFNDHDQSYDSEVHLAFQWVLDPDGNPLTNDAPNVVNASWGGQYAACDLTFQPDLQALRAARILPVFAAGNGGPSGPSDTSPANLPEAFAVGATATATTIASFSSLGPSRCGGGQYPALVAPGTGIRSTGRFGISAQNLEGTSFSAPHVAGALALLLQIAPGLSADQQASLLEQSAVDLGPQGADSTFGAGSLDVAAAARLLSPTLDLTPPVLSGASGDDLAVQVLAEDAASTIAGGEWWADADPGVGAGAPMTALDGAFDSPRETLTAALATLAPGQHVIGMRARDAAGNWSAPAEVVIVTPTPPPAVAPAPIAAAPPALVISAPQPRLRQVASDGFEHGLGGWRGRTGAIAASRRAALSGRRGLRATSAGSARTLVRRALPSASAEAELAFAFNPRAFSSARTWVEIAEISGTGGQRLTWIELRADAGKGAQLRLASSTGAGGVWHSRPQIVSRQTVDLALSVDSTHAALAVDGHGLESLTRSTPAPLSTTVALGLPHGARSTTTGFLDFDRVTVLAAS